MDTDEQQMNSRNDDGAHLWADHGSVVELADAKVPSLRDLCHILCPSVFSLLRRYQ